MWHRAEELFHAAVAQAPERRQAFLDSACGADTELRREVDRLVSADENAGSFLDCAGIAHATAAIGAAGSLAGRQFGHYRIEAPLGVGGMGEVYRAHDTRLGRNVAVKTLPNEFARDRERVSRLRREARTLASVNLPHIAAIYGIVHRDLKPANVKITPEGQVKVLDFGLAKAVYGPEDEGPLHPESSSAAGSVTGHVIGTPAYMSPEQARGERVDQRTDVWSFGCLLYELLTGERIFGAVTVPDTVASVLEQEPDWQRLSAKTPATVRRLLRHCLQKDVNQRLTAIGDARTAIQHAQRRAEAVARRCRWRRRCGAGDSRRDRTLVGASGSGH